MLFFFKKRKIEGRKKTKGDRPKEENKREDRKRRFPKRNVRIPKRKSLPMGNSVVNVQT